MTVNVRDLLIGQQSELLARLDNDRHLLDHPTEKGDASELDWRGVIDQFLPDRYKVARAQVLDSRDHVSDLLDVVIFDRQYCPIWFQRTDSQYIPAESVYAVFEAKQTLSREHVLYAGRKAASVRRLHRTSGAAVHAGGQIDDPKEPFRIPAGILTLESDWADPLGSPLNDALEQLDVDEQLDLGCALRDGAFEVIHKERGPLRLTRSDPDAALMYLLMRLFIRLQSLGTVPVIDLAAYAAKLEDS